jgi:F0F1-type ATP synthase delta subunit
MKTPRHIVADLVATRTLAANPRLPSLSRSIAAYLLESGRTGELESLLRDVIQIRAEHGVVEVVAVSVHKLTAAVEADIKRQVRKHYPAAKKIVITEQLDAEVVAGVRLEFPGEQLDLSVRAQLNHFKQLMSEGA